MENRNIIFLKMVDFQEYCPLFKSILVFLKKKINLEFCIHFTPFYIKIKIFFYFKKLEYIYLREFKENNN